MSDAHQRFPTRTPAQQPQVHIVPFVLLAMFLLFPGATQNLSVAAALFVCFFFF